MSNFNELEFFQTEIDACKQLCINTYHVAMNDDEALTKEEKEAFKLVYKYASERQTKFEISLLNAQLKLDINKPTNNNSRSVNQELEDTNYDMSCYTSQELEDMGYDLT